jgi:hypothetical protein
VLVTDPQELGTPEWERADWTGSQVSPNGYYHALNHPQHPHPEEAARGGIARRSSGAAGAPSDREAEFPATPLAVQPPYDPFAAAQDASGQGSGGKKTRTKPIRNAEGVLIRKDGRPDMRSVSSANNLRKVHAKKEAERAEMEGRTPTSARSLAPANSNSDDDGADHSGSQGSPPPEGEGESEAGPSNTQERHHELMSRIFPSGVEDASRGAAQRFFPPREQRDDVDSDMKTEADSEEPLTARADVDRSSQMTDVEMREMSDAQAEEHQGRTDQEDSKMPTVEEVSEEQETGATGA